eukprot:gene21350-8124_t
MAARRLQGELRKDIKNLIDGGEFGAGFDVGPENDDNLHLWKGVLPGPAGTPYEGGKFRFTIVFPEDYPFKAPKFGFSTK